MPQFTFDPNNPGAAYINTATSGFAEGVPPPPRKPKKPKKPIMNKKPKGPR
jgi:hypothetical protein